MQSVVVPAAGAEIDGFAQQLDHEIANDQLLAAVDPIRIERPRINADFPLSRRYGVMLEAAHHWARGEFHEENWVNVDLIPGISTKHA